MSKINFSKHNFKSDVLYKILKFKIIFKNNSI